MPSNTIAQAFSRPVSASRLGTIASDTDWMVPVSYTHLDEFEGATLTVTVPFTDGTSDTQTLSLHTGKLGVVYTDGTSGPQLTGEVLTDEQAAEQGYVYGVYAEIEE